MGPRSVRVVCQNEAAAPCGLRHWGLGDCTTGSAQSWQSDYRDQIRGGERTGGTNSAVEKQR